jgi:hypothetical protein
MEADAALAHVQIASWPEHDSLVEGTVLVRVLFVLGLEAGSMVEECDVRAVPLYHACRAEWVYSGEAASQIEACLGADLVEA